MRIVKQKYANSKTSAIWAMSPTIFFALVINCFCIVWSVWVSFTSSKLLVKNDFVGLAQYERLFETKLWDIALANLLGFSLIYISISFVFGYTLAACLDRGVRFERVFQTVFLMSSALSFVVAGLAWKWMLNPAHGLQDAMQSLGWKSFRFDWIVRKDRALYSIVLAGIWQSSGIVMIIILAGMRSVSEDIWRATRVDGIPTRQVYLRIIPSLIQPVLITALVILVLSAIKVFDLVVVMTGGGPGVATEVPAKFVTDMLFERSNIGQATAASTTILLLVFALLALRYLARRIMGSGGR